MLSEEDQTVVRLQQQLAEADLEPAKYHMQTLREKLSKYFGNPVPIIEKLELKGAWRIISIGDGKLLATIVDDGRVALLERQGDKLRELEKQVVHRDDEETCSWTPAGIAVSGNNIFVGNAAGAVPCDRVRHNPLSPTANNSLRKLLIESNASHPQRGKSTILRFDLNGDQLGEESTLFYDPSGMAFSGGNVQHVCDRADQSRQIVKLDTSLNRTGYYGSEEGNFLNPSAIDFDDDDGSIYVLDQDRRCQNCRVLFFSPEFKQLLRTFGENILDYPSYGILATKEFVYVTQTNRKNCVSVFDKQTGVFVISFGVEKLRDPVGITVDREGYIYVCDADHVWVF